MSTLRTVIERKLPSRSTLHIVHTTGETAMDLRGVGYLGFAVPDPDAWCTFATSVIGLMPAPAPPKGDDTIYLKGDDRQWRVALHKIDAGQPAHGRLAYVGLELGSQTAFDRSEEHTSELQSPC